MRKTLTDHHPSPRTVALYNGGANRGATFGLDAYERFQRESPSVSLVPRYVDAVPGRALTLKRTAEERGVAAKAIEGHIEEVLRGAEDKSPVVLNVDRAASVSETLRVVNERPRLVLGYLLIALPRHRLWGLSLSLSPEDALPRREAIRFFDRLAELSARRSSAGVLGEEGAPEHLAAQAQYRRWMAAHTFQQLGKATAGLPLDAYPLEVTTDGVNTLPVMIHETDDWAEPASLAEEFAHHPPLPLRRGESFIVAEVASPGLRFHQVRLRHDERLGSPRSVAFDEQAIVSEQEAMRRDERAREAALALRRAERLSVTQGAPVLTTD